MHTYVYTHICTNIHTHTHTHTLCPKVLTDLDKLNLQIVTNKGLRKVKGKEERPQAGLKQGSQPQLPGSCARSRHIPCLPGTNAY